jgi:hypothetical protein
VFDPKSKVIKKTGEKKVFRYYHCTNGKKTHPSLKGMNVPEDWLWNQFHDLIARISITEDFAKQVAETLNGSKVERRSHVRKDLEDLRAALTLLDRKLDQLADLRLAGDFDTETYQRQKMRTDEERRRLAAQIEQAERGSNDDGLETAQSILELAKNLKPLWELQTVEERREALDEVLSNPSYDGSTLRYDLISPLKVLSEMSENNEWRILRKMENPT